MSRATSAKLIPSLTGRPSDLHRSEHDLGAGDGDVVVALGALDLHAVGFSGRLQAGVELLDVGPAHVADPVEVGAGAGHGVDDLDAVEVHDDVADVTREASAAAVRRELEPLGVARAEEEQPVASARAAADDVAAVPGRPPHAAAEAAAGVDEVVSAARLDAVEVVAAEHDVVARPAEDAVEAVAAVERDLHQIGRGAQQIVAAEAVHPHLVGPLRLLDLHECRPEHDHVGCDAEDQVLLLLVGSVGGDAVDRPVGAAEPGEDLERAGLREVVDGEAAGAGAELDVDPLDGVVAGRPQVHAIRALLDQPVLALAELDAHAVEPVARDLEVDDAVGAEVDLEPPALAQGHRVVLGGAGDQQAAPLDPGAARCRDLDELAVAVAGRGAAHVAADPPGEPAGELGVLERGDEQQPAVERDRAAEQPLTRLGVLEQALAQRAGAHARYLELDGVDVRVARVEAVEGEHGLLQMAAPDGLGDVVQLVAADVVDVEAAGALERELGSCEHAVEQLGAARPAAALLDDALDSVAEVEQAIVQARVAGIGDHRGVVGGEDLGVGVGGRRGGGGRE